MTSWRGRTRRISALASSRNLGRRAAKDLDQLLPLPEAPTGAPVRNPASEPSLISSCDAKGMKIPRIGCGKCDGFGLIRVKATGAMVTGVTYHQEQL